MAPASHPALGLGHPGAQLPAQNPSPSSWQELLGGGGSVTFAGVVRGALSPSGDRDTQGHSGASPGGSEGTWGCQGRAGQRHGHSTVKERGEGKVKRRERRRKERRKGRKYKEKRLKKTKRQKKRGEKQRQKRGRQSKSQKGKIKEGRGRERGSEGELSEEGPVKKAVLRYLLRQGPLRGCFCTFPSGSAGREAAPSLKIPTGSR